MIVEPEFRSKPFSYDIDDLQALAGQVQRNWIRWYRIGAFTVFGMVALTILIDASIIPEDLDWAPLAAGLIAAILLLLFSSTRFRAWMWLKLMKRSPFYVPQSFGLLPSALFVDSQKGRSEIPFASLHGMKRADDRILFFMSKRLAYIVPSRAFDSNEQFEAFGKAAQERWDRRDETP